MKWNGYEFDEAYRPNGFEEWSQEKVNVGYAFYLRDKYVTDDTGLYEDTNEGTIHIFCPHFGETFEEDEKKVFGGKDAQYQCHCGANEQDGAYSSESESEYRRAYASVYHDWFE